VERGRLLKSDRLAYSFAIAMQSAILMVEFISFILILLVNPSSFQSYIINSGINLSPANKIFFTFISLFESPIMKFVGAGGLALFFVLVIIYFILIRKIWVKPVKESVYFTGIVLISTGVFCFFIINFWEIFSHFL